LAGGQSTRFGTPKGLASLNGVPLITHVETRLRKQTVAPIAVNCEAASPYSGYGDTRISDLVKGELGPLSGIHVALFWARANGWPMVATAPIDTPFLPSNYLSKLAAAGAPSVAESDGRIQAVCGLWRADRAAELKRELLDGTRSVRDWITLVGAKVVEFDKTSPLESLLNVNTITDLKLAQSHMDTKE